VVYALSQLNNAILKALTFLIGPLSRRRWKVECSYFDSEHTVRVPKDEIGRFGFERLTSRKIRERGS